MVVEGGDVEGVAGEVAGEGLLDDSVVLLLGGDLLADLRDLLRVGLSHSVDPGLDLEVCHADQEAVQQPDGVDPVRQATGGDQEIPMDDVVDGRGMGSQQGGDCDEPRLGRRVGDGWVEEPVDPDGAGPTEVEDRAPQRLQLSWGTPGHLVLSYWGGLPGTTSGCFHFPGFRRPNHGLPPQPVGLDLVETPLRAEGVTVGQQHPIHHVAVVVEFDATARPHQDPAGTHLGGQPAASRRSWVVLPERGIHPAGTFRALGEIPDEGVGEGVEVDDACGHHRQVGGADRHRAAPVAHRVTG